MAWVLINRANWRDAVAFKGKKIGAVFIDALVQDEEVSEGETVFDDEKIAVFVGLDLVI